MSTVTDKSRLDELLDLKPGTERCPHQGWAELREHGRVIWVERLGAYAVTRYEEVEEVLGDPERFPSGLGNPQGPKIGARLAEARAELAETNEDFQHLLERMRPDWRSQQVLLSSDGAEHAGHRAMVMGMFSARRAAALEPWIQELAERLVDGFEDEGVVELFTRYCMALPVHVIANQLGVDHDRIPDFLRWSIHANAHMGNDEFDKQDVVEHTRCNVEFSEYFRPLMEVRKTDPRDDFVTKIVQADDEKYHLTDTKRLAIISQMLNAGHETSSKTMAEAVARLAADPALADRLRANPDEVATFVEEVLRLTSPTQGLYRTVGRDTTLGGVDLPAGAPLLVLYASANRTESVFPHPDEVDIDRPNAGAHVAFGKGKHFCPGAALARIVVRTGVTTLLRRKSAWTVAEDAGGDTFNRSYLLHGRNELWIRFGGSTGSTDSGSMGEASA
jgi:cytochrome P450